MNCRLCGKDELFLFYTQGNKDEFRFYRCPACKMVHYDLAGGLDQTKYATTYPDPFDDSLNSNKAQSITCRALKRHLPVSGLLLDIGCGNGRLLYNARKDGYAVRGIEISPFLARCVQDTLGIQVDVADFLEYEAGEGGTHDVVVLRHVLEHLPDPVKALRSIRALLKDSGFGLLEFPNIDALDSRFKRWIRKAGLHRKKYPDSYRPGHCSEFCRESFEYLLQQTGFDLVRWETYSYKPVSNWMLNGWPIGNKARAIIRKK